MPLICLKLNDVSLALSLAFSVYSSAVMSYSFSALQLVRMMSPCNQRQKYHQINPGMGDKFTFFICCVQLYHGLW